MNWCVVFCYGNTETCIDVYYLCCKHVFMIDLKSDRCRIARRPELLNILYLYRYKGEEIVNDIRMFVVPETTGMLWQIYLTAV